MGKIFRVDLQLCALGLSIGLNILASWRGLDLSGGISKSPSPQARSFFPASSFKSCRLWANYNRKLDKRGKIFCSVYSTVKIFSKGAVFQLNNELETK